MPYNLIDKQLLYDGKKVRLEIRHFEDANGSRLMREVCVHPGAVCILPFVDAKTILLIRNYRAAIGQYLLELPAGTLEKNEDPMNCAGRELLEETGFLAGRIESLGDFFTSPGVLTEKMYTFAAYDLKKRTQALEQGEDIEVIPTTWSDALRMADEGEIQDGKTLAILLKFARRTIQT